MNERICLLIPYYEASDTIRETLNSVVLDAQDLILVIDDGSQHPAAPICPSRVGQTPVLVHTLECNVGITGALNAGLSVAPKEYSLIGRLDCGDLSAPERFTLQREYLRTHPDTVIVGSWAEFISPNGDTLYTLKQPTTIEDIDRYMHINCPLTHPTVLMRRKSIEAVGGYPTDYPVAEDFALFWALRQQGILANIGIPLVKCVTGDEGISVKKRRTQLQTRQKILIEHFNQTPIAAYGILRTTLQMLTSRRTTTFLRQLKEKLTNYLNKNDAKN